MIMLQDRDGISHHTAAEVYLDMKWQFIDPWLGVFPHKSDGTAYTRFEFAHDKSALEKYGYTPSYTDYEFAHSKIFETFPFMSFSGLMQKVFAKLRNLHESGPAGGLSNVDQNNKNISDFRMTDLQLEVLKLYDKARALHLEEDFVGARRIYSQLLINQELPTISDSARFFYGVTYFDEHKFGTAEKYFKREVAEHPANLWQNSEIRFLAESLISQGNITEAKGLLIKANSHGAQTRLKNLNENVAADNSSPFISH
jgi:tetratricopeptide (TPR) repeat protein